MGRHTKQNKRNKRSRRRTRRGGAATAFPLSYFNGKAPEACAPAGHDFQRSSGLGVRLALGPTGIVKGGGCPCNLPRRGGFYPSVMGSFAQSASKYIVPMSFYAGYKMFKTSQEKGAKRSSKRSSKRKTRKR
jgi:hypothetical protein